MKIGIENYHFCCCGHSMRSARRNDEQVSVATEYANPGAIMGFNIVIGRALNDHSGSVLLRNGVFEQLGHLFMYTYIYLL